MASPRSRLVTAVLAAAACLGALGTWTISSAAAGRPANDSKVIDGRLRLFFGGVFHTGILQSDEEGGGSSSAGRNVEALLVRDGRIVALGDFANVSGSSAASGAERVDLGGAHCFAGFQDAHGDLAQLGASLEEVDLSQCKGPAELVAAVRDVASSLPAGEWILGGGWDESRWEGAQYPNHKALSEAVPQHPVLVLRVDGLVGFANAKAMELAGVTDQARLASGIFDGTHLDGIQKHVPRLTKDVLRRRLLRAQDELLRLGVTAVHAVRLQPEAVEILAALRDKGELRLRVVGYVANLEALKGRDREAIEGLADRYDVFSVAGVGAVLDGGFGSRGAALLAPYADAPKESGQLQMSAQEVAVFAEKAARLGLQPMLQATGDRGVRTALAAFSQAAQRADGFSSMRPRIEHMQLVAEQDFARFKELGVIASMQPEHLMADLRWTQARLGDRRARKAYGWRTVQSRSSRLLAFGSAFPVGSPDPRRGIYSALTRQTEDGQPASGFYPSERISAGAAISAYTTGAAAAASQEDRRGQLALGYAADFTAFDVDLSQLTASTAKKALTAKVVATVVNGQVAYRHP